ncbi:PspC domain-containing protein [Candidatus Uabimicrobium sp. HlEnr_7]|uniref:PspC domain-containing protein n=1 Tax=Candidatus Uabimicrobium helgolandensis TaxID=3095367 RepID=UPI0035579AC7
MRGKYSYNYDNKFTINAKKVFEKYIDDCVAIGKQHQLLANAVCEYIKDKVEPLVNDYETVDAENMMDILSKLPSTTKIIDECREKPEFAEDLTTKLHLSDNNRFLGGVCGGLGEYFRIDPTLIRVAFIAGSFIGGAAVIIYAFLWLVLFEKEKDKDYPPLVALIFQLLNIARLIVVSMLWLISKKNSAHQKSKKTHVPENIAKEEQKPKKNRFFRRVFVFLSFVVMSLFIYLPSILVLLGIASFCLWGIFYPIVHIDGFQFSFAYLSIPGIIMAISAAVLTFMLFLLVITFVGRLHFKAKVMGKTMGIFTILFIVISIFSLGSSLAVTAFQNQSIESTTLVHNIPSSESIDINDIHSNSHVRIESVKIRGEKDAKEMTVRCEISARGENSDEAESYLQNIEVKWIPGKIFPEINKQHNGFHFEKAKIEIIVPATKKIAITGNSGKRLLLEGLFLQGMELNLTNSRVVLENVETSQLKLTVSKTTLLLEKVKASSIEADLQRTKIHIRHSNAQEITFRNYHSHLTYFAVTGTTKLHNDKGKVFINESSGILNIENHRGYIDIKGHQFAEKSQNNIDSQHGKLNIALSTKNLPQFNITNNKGRIRNKLPQFSSSDAQVNLKINHGRIHLHPISH